MKHWHRLTVCIAAGWLVASAPASAQAPASHDSHHAPGAGAADAEMASGEVRRIDRTQQKITLRHGEIKSLDMPPMSMIFRVRESEMLDAYKVGDRVLFSAVKDADGNYVITTIKPAP